MSDPRLGAKRCMECGMPFDSTGEFCSTPCRKSFNNRRMTRGAELYDLFMALRYERGIAYGMGVWTLLCRASQLFRREDERERSGRKSWMPPKSIIERRPYLKSTVLTGSKQ